MRESKKHLFRATGAVAFLSTLAIITTFALTNTRHASASSSFVFSTGDPDGRTAHQDLALAAKSVAGVV